MELCGPIRIAPCVLAVGGAACACEDGQDPVELLDTNGGGATSSDSVWAAYRRSPSIARRWLKSPRTSSSPVGASPQQSYHLCLCRYTEKCWSRPICTRASRVSWTQDRARFFVCDGRGGPGDLSRRGLRRRLRARSVEVARFLAFDAFQGAAAKVRIGRESP
jgi:hypothetical protein